MNNRTSHFSFKRLLRTLISVFLVCTMMLGLCSCAFFKKTFSKPAGYFQYVEEENLTNVIDQLEEKYADIRDTATSKDHGVKATLGIQLGDDILDLIEDQGNLDLSFINNLLVSIAASKKSNTFKTDFDVTLDKKDVASLSVIADVDNETAYLSIPDYIEKTLAVDFDELGIDVSALEDILEKTEVLEKLPEAKQISKILKKYVSIILDNISEAKKSEKTLKANGFKEECTAITVEISMVTVADILLDLIPTAVKDKDIEKLLVSMDELLSELDVDAELEDLWEDFKDNADDLIDDLEDNYEDLDDDTILKWTDYVNGSSEIIGRSIEFEDYGDTVEIFYGTAYEKDEFGFEFSYSDSYDTFSVIGEGTEKKGLIEGSYEVAANGETMIMIDVTDVDKKKFEDGFLKGKFEISLSNDMMDETDLGAIGSIFGSSISLLLDVDSSKDSATVTASLVAGKSPLFSVTLSAEETKASSIKIPSKDVEDNIEDWAEDIDIDNILDKLEEAGIPDDVLDLVELIDGNSPLPGYDMTYDSAVEWDENYDYPMVDER